MAAYLVYTAVVFGFLVPRYILMGRLSRERYAAVAATAVAIYPPNVLVCFLTFHTNWRLTAGMALAGPLLSLWVTLLICGIRQHKVRKR